MNARRKDLTDTFREALREAAEPSVERIAADAGYSRSSFDLYLNRRRPSAAAARALARTLRERAARLVEHAERLEAAADEAGGGEADG